MEIRLLMDAEHSDIDQIIVSKLNGHATEKQNQILEKWLSESTENIEQYELIKQIWQERSQDLKFMHANERMEKIWSRGHDYSVSNSKSLKSIVPLYLKIAASILLIAASIFIFDDQLSQKGNVEPVVENNLIIKGNPAGQKSKITLSDGSIVWLNSASSISYLENFTKDSRELLLEGEAYFEVMRDTLRPFLVKTGSISTIALGTSFNINAYDPSKIKVVLLTGKVKVVNDIKSNEPYFLTPGMGLNFNGLEESVNFDYDVENAIKWKNGILMFDGESFSAFKDKLERWYGITIEVNGNVPLGWSIRGQFDNESLDNVMESISFNKDFEFELKGKSLTIKF